MRLADIFTNDKGFFQGGKSFSGKGFIQPLIDNLGQMFSQSSGGSGGQAAPDDGGVDLNDGRGVIPWAQYEAEEAAKQTQQQPKRLAEVPQLAEFGMHEGTDFKTGKPLVPSMDYQKLTGQTSFAPRQRLATRQGLMNPNVQAQLLEQAQSLNIPAVGQIPGYSQQAVNYAQTGRRLG